LDEHLADLDMLAGEVRRQQPERPVFLFGHSLGGLIATLWCIERQPVLAGLVLSAPALRLRIDLSPWLLRAAGLAGRLLPRLRIVRVGFTRVSRDPAVVASFQADPLVFHGRLPLGTVAEMLRGIRRASGRFEALRLPLVILHGTADQICAPEGSRELCRRAGSGDRTLRLYEGFGHELLGDPQLDELVADLLAWLDRRSR
jgi:alpha-beta hydrolase superfamily lysophospholipase